MVAKICEEMTDEEIVALAKEGDITCEEYLINKYKGMAKSKSNTYFIAGADKEDVVQEGMIGIFKAIRDYDKDAGTSFSTFAELCVRRQILNAIKKADRKKNKALNESLYSGSESIEYDNIPLTNELDIESKILYKELFDFMRNANNVFSDFEREVWLEKYAGNNYKEIAEHLNKSPKTIDNALQRIKKKMNKMLMND